MPKGTNPPSQTADTVLVIDDDDGIQSLMQVLLERKQFSVDTARDGETALGKLKNSNGRYAVILLDLMMPRLNGFEVLRELRALQPELLNRTIIFTAASEQTLRGLDGERVFRVIRKPFDIQAVLGSVTDCAQRFHQPSH